MIIYTDLLSGDELFSDTFKVEPVGDHGLFYQVQGKIVKESDDCSGINIGSNPSAEEQAEELEEGVRMGCNIVLRHRLVEMNDMSKKDYMADVKKYTKKLKDKLEDMVKEDPSLKEAFDNFSTNMSEDLKSVILKDFSKKKYQFFKGESMGADGMLVLMYFPPEDETGMSPVMYFFKSGLTETKV